MRIILVLCWLIFPISNRAHADIFDIPKTESVMKKKYSPKKDLTAEIGYLPVGALSKYLAVGLAYTVPFTQNNGWEVINAIYTPELATNLKKELTSPLPTGYGVDSKSLATLNYLVTTNYVFSPLYTKSLLFNSSVVHSEFSFVGGGGIAGFNLASVATVDLGFIQRFFTAKSRSLKFDFRYYTFFSREETIKNNISLIVGYAWGFGD